MNAMYDYIQRNVRALKGNKNSSRLVKKKVI